MHTTFILYNSECAARRARRAAHSYFIEILQKALNLDTKTLCGLHRPPWALAIEYRLTWCGNNITWLYVLLWECAARRARRAAHFILQPSPGNFWENYDIGPHLWLKMPLSWVKIGPKCPRLSIFLILGCLCPNFEYMSPQNAWFWPFLSTILAIIFHMKVSEQKFWMQKKAESLLF